ncbi:MAG TPA: class I SAM-dependent methyltransferase [Candidatus Angelobacter sp.]|jgi:SAM-dependent methyltransferase|nr:class I SAM-dependent methyltransferase [Candidatus Angelobacter sp.]
MPPSPAALARRAARRLGLRRSDITGAVPVPDRAVPPYILNAVCHPDFWDDPEWLDVQRTLELPRGDDEQHRKRFEWVQCVYGLERLGALGPRAKVLGVGAGHERVLFHLANRSALTVATDLYTGAFTDSPAAEADPGFAADPQRYAPFPFRRDHLAVIRADGTRLPFPANAFDVVYSLSSIEHFGGHAAATTAMREMARVLKPGGIACVATELVLAGGEHPEFFTPQALQTYVIEQSGMVLVEKLHHKPLPQALLDDPVWLDGDIYKNPHLVLGRGEHRWTSVVLFLRKPTRAQLARHGLPRAVARAVRLTPV